MMPFFLGGAEIGKVCILNKVPLGGVFLECFVFWKVFFP